MSDWTAGYVSEIGYTYGYYRELCPALLGLAALSKGYRFDTNRPLRYLELGFGQGVSLNVHAAACNGEFWGTDFNPAQADHAKQLAAATGAKARIFDDSFAELASRSDLPEFDIIGVHGIWSWISDENRAVIVDIARRKLATGGLFYISYNCTPGWSAAMPLRHLMTLHAERATAPDLPMTAKIGSALEFAQSVVDAGAMYFKLNPAVADRLKKLKEQNRNYLAHEFFNRDWAPMPFSEVAQQLSRAKLEFACSANLFEHVDQISLSSEGQKLLAAMANPVLKESVRDYLQNTQFRKDVFIKGGTRLRATEQLERYQKLAVVLTTPAADVPLKLTGPVGEVGLNADVYEPILALLADQGHAPKTLGDLHGQPTLKAKPFAQLLQAILILTGGGHVQPVQDAADIEAARSKCKALNAELMRRAKSSGDIIWLAAPVIGGGIAVGRFPQLFLLAREQGKSSARAMAEFAWACLQAEGERLLKDGKPIEASEENISVLLKQAELFEAKQLPILRAVGVA